MSGLARSAMRPAPKRAAAKVRPVACSVGHSQAGLVGLLASEVCSVSSRYANGYLCRNFSKRHRAAFHRQ